MAKQAGTNSNDVKGITDFDMCWKKYALNFCEHDQQVMQTRKIMINIENTILGDKSIKTVLAYKNPFYNHLGKLIGTWDIAFVLDYKNIINCLPNNLRKEVEVFQSKSANFSSITTLTSRQLDCLYYLAKGMQIKQIANELNLSRRTIEHYLENLKVKLNCYSRSDLIKKALEFPAICEKLFHNK